MMLDRRTFVVGAALTAGAPIPGSPVRSPAPPGVRTNRVVFMVDGWGVQNDKETFDQVWIRIDRGWRTSWR
jgi:hypothetical protein